jgi:double-stranded uracil-DNA glycosylase
MASERAHILPDVLGPGLDLVFCGTAAGVRSANDGAYYAHPGNFFWRTLHTTGLTPRLYAPWEFAQLLALGIGFTDLAKHHAGNDDQLPADAFDVAALKRKIVRHAPRIVAFTSKNAAQAALGHAVDYGLQGERLGPAQVFVLPSPSGQARRFWDVSVWQTLAQHVIAR